MGIALPMQQARGLGSRLETAAPIAAAAPPERERRLQIARSMVFTAHPLRASLDSDLAERFRELERKLAAGGHDLTLRAWLDCAEAWRILEALRHSRGNRSAAARALGIGRRTLYTKMEKLGIQPSWGPANGSGLEPHATGPL